ncbi:MAG: MATE family efflux transporter [Lachnospiraceae bacterium]|nr:MATE family efflux transporter [Lachnospiraceae bacterium]
MEQKTQNPLGTVPVSKLMVKFAVPSIVAMLVGALYNIVDQFFIGQKVGTLGNAATNIAFPLSTSCIALALLFGIGGASCFNLTLGRGENDKAPYFVGNAFIMLIISGSMLCLVTQLFLTPMLIAFGAPDDVLPFAQSYVRITSFGFPFLLMTTGGGHLMRADGSPRMTMFCNLSGAVINTVLDAFFVLVLEWGMEGAALATVIGQVFSGVLVIHYMCHYKTVSLRKEHLRVRMQYIGPIMSIGMASFFNQLAIMLVQIVLNNSLKYYGSLSVYGESIPLACAGIVMKVSQLSFSVVIGIAQGTQPIESFNYGAKNYGRVREAYKLACMAGGVLSLVTFAVFQLFPRQILGFFGDGTEEYFAFGEKYFRIFLFFTILNFLQPITSTFFTSIGKAVKGIFLSLTRQVLFLIPLVLILPRFMGIDGIVYAGPISDAVAVLTAVGMVMYEFKGMRKLEREASVSAE